MTDRLQPQFTEILTLIKTAQNRVIANTNQELIQLYWTIGTSANNSKPPHGDKKRSNSLPPSSKPKNPASKVLNGET
jgi:hypothetical protein